MKHRILYSASATLAMLVAFSGCSKLPMTSALFRQSGRTQIFLPTKNEEKAAILTEKVLYKTTVDTIKRIKPLANSVQDSSMKSFELGGVVVTADRPKVKISPIRNGIITLSFLATLPKSFMNDNWQVVLYPKMLNGDSIVPLKPVVLQGKHFKAKQNAMYASYDKFVKSIADTTKYDSLYFDKSKHAKFMKALSEKYLDDYKRDYDILMKYLQWREFQEMRYSYFAALQEGVYDTDWSQDGNNNNNIAIYNTLAAGQDSAKIADQFRRKYTDARRKQTIKARSRTIRLQDIPVDYRMLYRKNFTLDSLKNKSITERDSLNFARYTRDFKTQALNEGKRRDQDMYRRHTIRFERIENTNLTDSIIPGREFSYMYSEDLPVTPDLGRKIKVVVDTRVIAVDGSTWSQLGIDTLDYIVSGMNDLLDKSQIDRLEGDAKATYQQGIDRLAVRDYRGALDILNHYPDYNAAVCLVALGFNNQAEQFLEYLKPANGNVDYLKAIVQVRLGNLDKALEYLLSSARKDPRLAYRAENEPEFAKLFERDETLVAKLIAIGDGEE